MGVAHCVDCMARVRLILQVVLHPPTMARLARRGSAIRCCQYATACSQMHRKILPGCTLIDDGRHIRRDICDLLYVPGGRHSHPRSRQTLRPVEMVAMSSAGLGDPFSFCVLCRSRVRRIYRRACRCLQHQVPSGVSLQEQTLDDLKRQKLWTRGHAWELGSGLQVWEV